MLRAGGLVAKNPSEYAYSMFQMMLRLPNLHTLHFSKLDVKTKLSDSRYNWHLDAIEVDGAAEKSGLLVRLLNSVQVTEGPGGMRTLMADSPGLALVERIQIEISVFLPRTTSGEASVVRAACALMAASAALIGWKVQKPWVVSMIPFATHGFSFFV